MRAVAVTQRLQFSPLDVDFYCSISCQLETRGERLLPCKAEPSEAEEEKAEIVTGHKETSERVQYFIRL